MLADHPISDVSAFAQAAAGQLVKFGVVPTRAETGYAYRERGHEREAGGAACDELAAASVIWPGGSIDYALLTADGAGAVVMAPDAGRSDVGSCSSLWQVSPKGGAGNVTRGDVCAIESHNRIVFAEHHLVAALECDILVIIEAADSVMVAPQDSTEDVNAIVEWLTAADREEHLTYRKVYRPWGSYESIDCGSRFQVKRITVKIGEALSGQMHHQRGERWSVVPGTEWIEVQSGDYFGEDDIVRSEGQ